ncbi:unnamed protein product [Orchesella dallaii]|uniref:Uncharacterized protein n=1 Tax=Orchesella dallaii TaxID=48710 RepID=A0ABP1QYD1_9HEXA
MRPQLLGFLYFTIFITGCASVSPPVKLATGIHTESIPKIFYESTINIIYEVPLFAEDSIVLENFTCAGAECSLIEHIKRLSSDTLNILKYTLPTVENIIQPKKSRRSFLSSAFYYCCGFAESAQVDILTKTEKDLSTYTENLKNQVVQEHDAAVQTRTLINKYSDDMRYNVQSMIKSVQNNIDHLASEEKLIDSSISDIYTSTSILAKVQHRMALTMQYRSAITDCLSHRIPSSLISAEILRNDLLKLAEDIIPHKMLLAVINPFQLLSLETTTCYFSNKTILVRVQVPVVSRLNTYKLYSSTSIPFHYNNSICHLLLPSDYFILKNEQEVIPLSGKMLTQCVGGPSELCHISRYQVSSMQHINCLRESLFATKPISEYKDSCTFACSSSKSDQPIIYQFSPVIFGILQPPKDSTLKCKNEPNQQVSVSTTHGYLEVHLECHCELHLNTSIVSPDFPCLNSTEETYIHHVVPAIWTVSDSIILTPHTLYANMAEIINHRWPLDLPTLNLSSPTNPVYELPIHVDASSKFFYILVFIVFLVCIGIYLLFKKLNAVDVSLIISSLIASIFPAVRAAPLQNNAENSFIFETMELVFLFAIFCTLVLILLTLRSSSILSILNDKKCAWTKGKIRLQLFNASDNLNPQCILRKTLTRPIQPPPLTVQNQQILPKLSTTS